MGFFDSKTKIDQTTTYDNPELRSYTAAYRGFAPWSFSSFDPDAALYAMGKGTKIDGKNIGVEGKEYLKGLSTEERTEREASNAALKRIQERQSSGQFLTSQETDFINRSLDKAFEYAQTTGMQAWERGAQSLAGGRGLRTSDTPVAKPAMEELRNLQLGLGSKRAELGLGATMQFSAQQQAFDEAFREALEQMQFNRWSTRAGHLFGGGLQAAGNLGYTSRTTGTQTNKASGFQKVMGSMAMVSGGLDLVGKIGSMASGFAAPTGFGGMGGGGAANFSGANFPGY